ncbi:MAG: LLM class flavin-dependent oxidoreductase, partial [Actinomycetota bacterium]
LGTQVKRVNELRYATPFEHPAPKIRETVEVCRAVWRAFGGQPIEYRGRFYTVTMGPFPGAGPPQAPIPIGLAAVNAGMVRLTGEVADVFLGHPFSSPKYFTQAARPALDQGLQAAGRKTEECRVAQGVIASVAATTDEAMRGAKLQIAFYGTTRTYAPVFEMHGFAGTTAALRDAFGKGDFEAMIAAVSDEMAETYSVFGTPDEVREKIRRWEGLADEVILGPPWASADFAKTAETFDGLIEAFGPR